MSNDGVPKHDDPGVDARSKRLRLLLRNGQDRVYTPRHRDLFLDQTTFVDSFTIRLALGDAAKRDDRFGVVDGSDAPRHRITEAAPHPLHVVVATDNGRVVVASSRRPELVQP